MDSQELILVVDDEAEITDLIELTLTGKGYSVKSAYNGQQAMAMLNDSPIALLITDLMMPDISGLELLVEMKSLVPTAEVILITAHGSLETAIEALHQGAHDYIIKPFGTDELVHSVEQALSYRRLKSEKKDLLTELQQHNDELGEMLEASNRLTHLNPQSSQLVNEIIDIAQQYLGLTLAITTLDKSGEYSKTIVPQNFQPAWKQVLTDASITKSELQRLITEGDRLSQSYSVGSEITSWFADETDPPAVPLLLAPLKTGDDSLLGCLWMSNIHQAIPTEVIRRVEIFANQVVGILDNVNLFADQARQVRVQNALVEAGQRITTVLDQQEVINTVLKAALKIIPQIDLAIIYYLSETEPELKTIGLTMEQAVVTNSPLDGTVVADVLKKKQTYYQSDWYDPVSQTNKSLILEPLVSAGSPLGVLVVTGQQPDAFDEDQQQVLKMLANQATIALQNARLYAEARRVDEVEALYEAGRVISRTLNLQETVTTTMAIARSLTGGSLSNIYLYTSNHRRIDSVVTLSEELSLSDADRRRASKIAQDVLENEEPYLAVESQTVPGAAASGEPDRDKYTIQSWLAVPLPTTNSPLGVLELGSERADAFTVDDVRLMQVIASQSAAAIENARLFEEAQRRLQQTEALSAISQSISMTLDLQRVLELVVHSAAKTIPVATHSTLYLYDQTSETFVPEAKVVKQDQPLSTDIEVTREKAIQQAIKQRDTVRMAWQSDEHLFWSLLVAPLKVSDAVIGAISVESARIDAFTPSDETLLNTFASHASIAIQNANLFQELSSAYLDLASKQEEILRSHSTLQALFDSITDGLYIVDQNLKIVAINQAETERLGKRPEELIGQSCDTKLWGEATKPVLKIIRNTFDAGQAENWESQLDVANRGPFTDRDVRTYPIFKGTGEISQVIIFAQDVSEKRRLQASLFRSANLAAVGQLAASIAHQINNPLTVIIANTQIMGMDLDANSSEYPIIKHVEEAGTQIREIVQNLLDFSTQDSYEWFETDVRETINEALTLVTHSLRKSNINVVQQAEELPLIIASKSHLKLLWMNLLLNARDAIVATGREGEIQFISTQTDNDHVQIQIQDNGIGVSSQLRDRLFHPFFTTKINKKNLGLGLYTCRSIVEAHQGQITIASDQECPGAVVTVTLPIHAIPHLPQNSKSYQAASEAITYQV